MDYKTIIMSAIDGGNLSKDEIYSALMPTQNEKNGEMCLPCFKFSAKLRKPPQQIASQLQQSLKENAFI